MLLGLAGTTPEPGTCGTTHPVVYLSEGPTPEAASKGCGATVFGCVCWSPTGGLMGRLARTPSSHTAFACCNAPVRVALLRKRFPFRRQWPSPVPLHPGQSHTCRLGSTSWQPCPTGGWTGTLLTPAPTQRLLDRIDQCASVCAATSAGGRFQLRQRYAQRQTG